ncbi:MAG TPA: hypothetical protein VF691_20835 [Cytophagaceae bacterium]|jgi:hypothetical protein
MNYLPLRKDLTEGKRKCYFCGRQLTSLKAFVLENVVTKEEVFSGPKCAQDNISDEFDLRLMPDLTVFTLAFNLDIEGVRKGRLSSSSASAIQKDIDYKKAIEYIELRENKLLKDLNESYEPLKNYYLKYRMLGRLDEIEIQHITNIELKTKPSLKLVNLQKFYNHLFWINIAISLLGERANDYLVPIKESLCKYRNITEAQKNGVNKWLKNLDGIPQLK